MSIVNLSGYLFVEIEAHKLWQHPIQDFCSNENIRGTIILAPEGINLFVAGSHEACENLIKFLRFDNLFKKSFKDLQCKYSESTMQPFNRMLVKVKKEIITMRHSTIHPEKKRAASVSSKVLRKWLDNGHDDEGREVVMLDTRNGFEVDVGTFKNAIDWRLKKFSDFPEEVKKKKQTFENKTVVSFCTGGIRCEKAVLYMNEIGIQNVYQLDGGILNYFAETDSKHFDGDCFVFDYRTALTPELKPSGTVQCYACRAVVDRTLQLSEKYKPGIMCPSCAETSANSPNNSQKSVITSTDAQIS